MSQKNQDSRPDNPSPGFFATQRIEIAKNPKKKNYVSVDESFQVDGIKVTIIPSPLK